METQNNYSTNHSNIIFNNILDDLGTDWNYIIRDNAPDIFNKTITLLESAINSDVDKLAPIYNDIFNAFKKTSWQNLKVVLIGQDPYPTPGDAMGLSFSVNRNRPIPKSLLRIYDCLRHFDIIDEIPSHGDLSKWADQGVLLLNSALTTLKGVRRAHALIWEPLTDNIIKQICKKADQENKKIIFMLWGNDAHKKEYLISENHHILKWGHPSPLSSVNNKPNDPKNFRYCDHFHITNQLLMEQNIIPIDWSIE